MHCHTLVMVSLGALATGLAAWALAADSSTQKAVVGQTAGEVLAAQPKTVVVPASADAAKWREEATAAAPHRTLDLKLGEQKEVALPGGAKAAVKLLAIETAKDDLRGAIRAASVKLLVNGEEVTLPSAMYNLPRSAGGAQVDCPVVGQFLANSRGNPWALDADARIRLWPAGAAWIEPNSFGYPVRQRWFATPTQMANEPTYVDGVEDPLSKKIYYHYALDFGGAEGATDILSTTDGLVISAGNQWLDGYQDTPSNPRYDQVYVMDRRGWLHRYCHLYSIDPGVKVGEFVKLGQRVGALGKEGDSGGWSHLHYQIDSRAPSGRWGSEEGYAYVWQAYMREHAPKIVAVARPHVLASAGSTVELDGGKSFSPAGKIEKYEWTFTDGATADGAKVRHKYAKAGQYCETLKVTDSAGNVGYDFAIVQIIDAARPKDLPPGIHLAFTPTLGVKPAQEVTFKVRSFAATAGEETIDFGDGTPAGKTKSDGGSPDLAKGGYVAFGHAFAKAGQYIVTARHTNERGQQGVTRVVVVVEPAPKN